MCLPTISVITPNFNYASSLERTIRSVVDQKYPRLEYIIMDGGSTDESVEVIRRYEGRLAHWESRNDGGQYDAINRGMERATGDICAWLNSDDVYYPWTFRVVAEIFRQFPDVDWITGLPGLLISDVPAAIAPLRPYPQALIRSGLFVPGTIGTIQQESTFWRRALWQKAGPIPLQYRLAGDFALWARFAAFASLTAVAVPIGSFSVNSTNRSRAQFDIYQRDVAAVIQSLDPQTVAQRRKFRRILGVWEQAKRYPGLRTGVRGVLRSEAFDGPVLRVDIGQQLTFRYETMTLLT